MYESDYLLYKEKMLNEHFHIPVLTHNMRNSSSVVETMDCLYVNNVLKLSVQKAPLPPNPVPGNPPIVVPTQRIKTRMYKPNVVASVIEKYFETDEPVVVLVIKPKIKKLLKNVRYSLE